MSCPCLDHEAEGVPVKVRFCWLTNPPFPPLRTALFTPPVTGIRSENVQPLAQLPTLVPADQVYALDQRSGQPQSSLGRPSVILYYKCPVLHRCGLSFHRLCCEAMPDKTSIADLSAQSSVGPEATEAEEAEAEPKAPWLVCGHGHGRGRGSERGWRCHGASIPLLTASTSLYQGSTARECRGPSQ